jgi:Domain of unknown function (DUF4386)
LPPRAELGLGGGTRSSEIVRKRRGPVRLDHASLVVESLPKRADLSSTRKISLAAGVLFLVTFITSIPALGLFQPVLDDPAGYLAGDGEDIAVGILSVLAVVTLRQDDPDAASLAVSLAAIKDWTFLLGPGFIVGIGNGLILGYLMYRSGLVPRGMAMLGLIGGPLVTLSGIAALFDVIDAPSTWQGIATIPEFVWELSLGIYLTVKGFKPSPIIGGGR